MSRRAISSLGKMRITWLAALLLLPLPIVSICETGGRLAHALVRVDASSKDDWDRSKDALVPVLTMLGADTHILSAVRLTRLPCCQRLGKKDKDGKYQKFPDGPHLQRLLYQGLLCRFRRRHCVARTVSYRESRKLRTCLFCSSGSAL